MGRLKEKKNRRSKKEIHITITSAPVVGTPRKLRAIWTPESQKELNNFYDEMAFKWENSDQVNPK